MKIAIVCVLIVSTFTASRIAAYDSPMPFATVKLIDTTYLPGSLVFQIDQTVANCGPGEWISYEGGALHPPSNSNDADRKANIRAVQQSMLAAMHTKGRVRFFARNKTQTTSCVVEYMHFLPA